MSQEILYTSAPKGLKTGSRGFCTVVSTPGMAKNLAERLESLSGYQHAFMAHEAGADQNPVNFAHYRMTLGGRKYHVLSRICDAGLDYTQRTNKLAHHVALEPQEVSAAIGGPAYVLASEGFCVEQWDGQVKILPAGRKPTTEDCPPAVCRAWEAQTGDAGWAGVLAASASGKSRPMSVIFKPGTDVLPLVVEAMALVPRDKRWDVTFSTYFTKAPAGVDCQWRFLLDGTPEATALRRNARAEVIDLCKPLGQAKDGPLVQAARTGTSVQRAATPGAASSGPATRAAGDRARAVSSGTARPAPLPPGVEPPPSRGTAPGMGPYVKADTPSYLAQRKKNWLLIAAIPLFALVCIVSLLTGIHIGTGGSSDDVDIVVAPKKDPQSGGDSQPPPPPVAPREDDEPEGDPEDEPEPMEADQDSFAPAPPKPVEPEPEPEPPKEVRPEPFENLDQLQNKLELPPQTITTGGGAFARTQRNTESQELAKLYVDDVTQCTLEVLGSEFASSEGRENAIEVEDQSGARTWNLTADVAATNTKTTIGTFGLKDDRLVFRWGAKPAPIRMQLCRLKITVGNQSRECALNQTTLAEPFQLDVDRIEYQLPLEGVTPQDFRTEDPYRVDILLDGLAGTKDPKATLSPGKTASIRVPNPLVKVDNESRFVDVEVAFVIDQEARKLVLMPKLYAHPMFFKPNGGNGDAVRPSKLQLCDALLDKLRDTASVDLQTFMANVSPSDKSRVRDWIKLPVEQRRQALQLQALKNERTRLTNRKDLNKAAKADQERRLSAEIAKFDTEINELTYSFQLKQFAPTAIAYQDIATFADSNIQWCGLMEQFLHTLHRDGRLHYRLYLESDGRKIDLAMTPAFQQEDSDSKK